MRACLITCALIASASPACTLFGTVTFDGGRTDGSVADAAVDAPTCPPGRFNCDDNPDCETPESETDCGRCGRRCRFANATGVCMQGACSLGMCAPGFGDCDRMAATGCEAPLDSATNCRACGTVCTGATPSCGATGCTAGCPATGQILCNGTCVDPLTDAAHCGLCDNRCGTAANGQMSCVAGGCRLTCNPGFANCDGRLDNGCETTLATNSNCASCGNACVGMEMCNSTLGGMPQCSTAMCMGGNVERCVVGAGAVCVDTTRDPAHCGGCNTPCQPLANQSATCAARACNRTCNEGYGDCDMNPANGCEAALNTATQCGMCGARCEFANAAASCASRTCAMGACAAGWGNCDANAANGCETNTNTTVAHCGACGRACPAVDHGQPGCAMGVCGVGTCDPGYADCDRNPANGCEANLATDAANCGMCGRTCSVPAGTGTATCAMSTCRVTCPTGFGDCDNNVMNGCEADLSADENCGFCGNNCGAMPGCAGAFTCARRVRTDPFDCLCGGGTG